MPRAGADGGVHWPNMGSPLTPLRGLAVENTDNPTSSPSTEVTAADMPPSPVSPTLSPLSTSAEVTAADKPPPLVNPAKSPAPDKVSPNLVPENEGKENESKIRPCSPPTPQSCQDPKRERGETAPDGQIQEGLSWFFHRMSLPSSSLMTFFLLADFLLDPWFWYDS